MPKLLILTHHFPPSAASGAFRLLGFARHLPAAGWRVGVVAPPTIPWEAVDPRLVEQVPPETVRFDVPFTENRLVKKLFGFESWLPRARAAAHRAMRDFRPDAVLTSGPDHSVHLLGADLKWRYKIPWVADFRDPWYTARTPHDRPGRLAARLERLFFSRADVVVWNTPAVREAICAEFPALAGKMVAITNGFDPEQFGPRTRAPRPGEPIEILHAGSVHFGRDPRAFLEGLASLDRDGGPLAGNIRVAFVGAGDEGEQKIVPEVHRLGLSRSVTVEGHQPYARTLQRMVDSDLLLLLDGVGRRSGVPAKLYEYLGAGRPVLALGESDGDLAWVLNQSGALHRIANPGNAAEIGLALAALVDDLKSGRSPAAVDLRLMQFTRAGIARQLASVLDRCIGTAGSPEGS